MMYRIISNLFNRAGLIDLDGDEEEINTSATTYQSRCAAIEQVEYLTMRYPNAFVDLA